jgi:hypothetical protein
MSPENSEAMAFLGHNPVRCKFVVDNKCLQKTRNFKYLYCEISCGTERNNKQKLSKFAQIMEILNNTFKPNLSLQIFKDKRIHWLPPFFYKEAKFGPLEKKNKKCWTSIEVTFFRRTAKYTLFG